MSISDLKKRRGRKGTEKLAGEAAKLNKPGSFEDERFWKHQRDKSDNGFAIVRFLPAITAEDIPWVRTFSHGFQGPTGQWYIENCPTTISGDCPACKRNSELWNSGIDANKDIARKRKRRLQYISNVYIVSDPKNPENEGKAFMFKYGVKIFDKLMEAMNPEFEDENPVNPFCFWDGADFKIKIRKVKGYINYDKSEFASPSQLLNGGDEELEALYETQYALQPFVAPGEFKKFDDLKTRLDSVLSTNGKPRQSAAEHAEEDTVEVVEITTPISEEVEVVSEEVEVVSNDAGTADEAKDAKSYFEGLADED